MRLIQSMTLVGAVLAVVAANADTIYVCWDGSGDYLTIQEGINAAHDGDEVVVCDGTYTGDGNKDLEFGGRTITVRSENGPETCIVDCEGDGRGFYFHSGERPDSIVEGLTITNGRADDGGGVYCENSSSPTFTNCTFSGSSASSCGGGMSNESNSSPTLTNCTFSVNSADFGGGMCNFDSSPTVTNCMFAGNSTSYHGAGMCNFDSSPTISDCTFSANEAIGDIWVGYGGGMYNGLSSPTVTNCLFSGNLATAEDGGGGGGMYNIDSTPTVTNCTFSNNYARAMAGGMGNRYSSPTVTNCVFAGNSTSYHGAGMYSFQSSPTVSNCTFSANAAVGDYVWPGSGGGMGNSYSSPTVTNCMFSGNSATADGGGMRDYSCSLTVTNCTFSGNLATAEGGGMSNDDSSLTVVNCTFSGNLAGSGGGMSNDDSGLRVVNCIVWGNTASSDPQIYGSATVTYSCIQAGWPGEGNIDADPLFVDPDGPDDDPNTWEDNDFHLAADSPCIDAGCNWAVPPDTADLDEDGDTSEYTPLDLDGEGRFFDDPDTDDTGCGCSPIVDMGAFEFGDAGPQPCPGDLDCDRVVGHSDLGILLSAWQNSAAGDLNCDGDTDHSDLGILLAHWGEGCP